jgi:hypothetical protein
MVSDMEESQGEDIMSMLDIVLRQHDKSLFFEKFFAIFKSFEIHLLDNKNRDLPIASFVGIYSNHGSL